MKDRILTEIQHGKKIVDNAGLVWSWETPAGQLRWRRRVEMLTDSIKPGNTVLEVGCGTGFFTKELAKKGADIYSIDISPDLIEKAKCEAPQVKFSIEDAHSTSFSDNFFDIVLGSSVLHHLESKLALKEFYRILKPGGYLYFTEPNMLNPQIALQKNIPWIKEKMGDSPHETAFFKWSIENELKELGYKQIKIEPFDFLHPSIPKNFLNWAIPLTNICEKIPVLKEISGSLFIVAVK